MANMVNVTIDGKMVQAPEGSNLIDAAELAGVHIPNLCYLKGMKGIGACRVCLVEIEGSKAPMIGCTTRVKEGMVVNTQTERVREVRKFVIDLILSMHPLDCMTCTKAGVCRLQEYAYDMGVKESSFTRKSFAYPTDEANPFIKRDPDYCVLCGRCVRVCKEQGTHVLEFMGRGVGSKVTTAQDKPLQESGCTFCGSCVDVCPVNALLEADRSSKGREWDYDHVSSTCLLCGNGCEINVSTKDGRLMKVNAGAVNGSTERFICAYGRFGFDCVEAENRLTTPLKRVNNELVETTWEDALSIVAAELKKSGADAGFVATGGMLNEDALTLKRLASDAVQTKNVDTTVSLYGDAATLISGSADLETADLFVVVDLDANQWKRVLPAIDAVIRRRVAAGAKLITINSKETNLGSLATVNLMESESEALRSLAKALMDKGVTADSALSSAAASATVTEAMEKAASLYAEAKNPVILTSPAMYASAANIGLMKGSVVSVPVESNAKGVVLMGLNAEGKSYAEMTRGGMKLLYTVGEVPVTERPANTGCLIVQHSHLSDLAKQADVVLPAATYLEAEGTMVDYLGRLRDVCKAVEPAGESMSNRAIFVEVSKAMGAEVKEATESEASSLAAVESKAVFSDFAKRDGLSVNVDEMIESINASVINGSRLLWLKEGAACTV